MILAEVSEIEAARHKRAWVCGHCQHINDADDLDCDSCGNLRDASTADQRIIAREYAADEAPGRNAETLEVAYEGVDVPQSEAIQSERRESEAERLLREGREAAERKRKRKLLAILGGVLLAIGLVVWVFSLKKEVDFQVKGFSWHREVRIQKFGPHAYSTWDYPPSGAYSISSREEVHHYDQIFEGRECHSESRSYKCGTIDNGNGTFSDKYCSEDVEVCNDKYRDEPVYATKYYYTIDEWAYDHTVKAEGEDHVASWPMEKRVNSNPSIWREGPREGRYYLHFKTLEGKLHRDEVPEGRWNKTTLENTVIGFVHPWFGYFKGLKKE